MDIYLLRVFFSSGRRGRAKGLMVFRGRIGIWKDFGIVVGHGRVLEFFYWDSILDQYIRYRSPGVPSLTATIQFLSSMSLS